MSQFKYPNLFEPLKLRGTCSATGFSGADRIPEYDSCLAA